MTTLEEAVVELEKVRTDLFHAPRKYLDYRGRLKDRRQAILAAFPDADPGHAAWVASFKDRKASS